MISEIIDNIVNTTITSFDFSFCITVNIATYLYIKQFECKESTIWDKRKVLVIVSIILGIIYYFTGTDLKTIINSVVLAPVSWSWILKPICNKLKIDYNNECDIKDNKK